MPKEVSNKELKHLHDVEGKSFQAIADMFGMTRQNVHARLRYYRTPEYNKAQNNRRKQRAGKK